MITVVSGTNRPNSMTKMIAQACVSYLQSKVSYEVHLVDLVDMNQLELAGNMYEKTGQAPYIQTVQQEKMIPSNHWLIISPEYNGSYPGILKLFIDALSANNYKDTFANKKASLIGVASGRAGNLRGMDHLTGLLNYLNITVMPNKMPISSIGSLVDESKNLQADALTPLHNFLDEVIAFKGV